ncbi:MAG: YgfZ/GcvT domain-containing protein [Pseudomonadota bacterium]
MSTATTELRFLGDRSGYVLLEHKQIVRISGPGTDKFIQGQFSQHVDEITASQSLRAAACTPKGRAYCLTRFVRDGDDLLMELDTNLAEPTLNQLRKYLMLFRGTSMEVLESAQLMGLIGQEAAVAVAGSEAASLTRPGQVLRADNGFLVRIEDMAGPVPRYEFWQPDVGITSPDGIDPLSTDDWNASSIAAGVPWLTSGTTENYVPQMLNLQHLQGIHFKKGCYTGQEVVARMHFLGQLKKSLFRLNFQGINTAPAPGTKVQASGRNAGEVINSVMTGSDHGTLLAVLRHDTAEAALALDGNDSVTLQLDTLPYPVPEREEKSDT